MPRGTARHCIRRRTVPCRAAVPGLRAESGVKEPLTGLFDPVCVLQDDRQI